MRPKVVLSILVLAFGILGVIALVKGLSGKNQSSSAEGTNAPAAGTVAQGDTTNGSGQPVAGTVADSTVSDQMRAALIDKAVDEIRDIQGAADGTNNAQVITALLDKMSNPEREVRDAALQAIKELNDTNAVPGLLKVCDSIKDIREKAGVLNVIDFLNLPSATPELAPDATDTSSSTNFTRPAVRPNLMPSKHTKREHRNVPPAAAEPMPQ